MNAKTVTHLILAKFLLISNGLFAQETEPTNDYHPFLTDKFHIGIGGFWPQKSFEIQVDGTVPGDQIDFDESLRVDDSDATGALTFRWNFGEKWSLQTQAWKVDSGGGAVLTEDLHWQDLVFKEGSFVNAGVDLKVARIFFGRDFFAGPNYEFGAGVGLHWLEIGAFIEGDVQLEDGGTDFQRGSVDGAFPLPNLGAWYIYSWSPNWLVQAKLDWLDVDIGDYSGGLINAAAGVHWQPFEHVGFGLEYASFTLDVDITKTDWHGSAETTQHGPRFSVSASW